MKKLTAKQFQKLVSFETIVKHGQTLTAEEDKEYQDLKIVWSDEWKNMKAQKEDSTHEAE